MWLGKGALIRNDVWPEGLHLDLSAGFSDDELEFLSSEACGRRELHPITQAPWLFFSSEVYGIGRAIRYVTRWPDFLPICFASDHGVSFAEELFDHEFNNFSKAHLTWSSWRSKEPLKSGKTLVRTVHPWVLFRRKAGIALDAEARGTVLFVDHSWEAFEVSRHPWEDLFSAYGGLDKDLRPRALCLHPTDIRKGLHKELRSSGLPIVTAGNSQSPLFVDRFYDIVRNFHFATSSHVGSHLFYCEELGLRCFLFGAGWASTESVSPGGEAVVQEQEKKEVEFAHRISFVTDMFREIPPSRSLERDRVVSEGLGSDLSPYHSRSALSWLLLAQLFVVIPGLILKVWHLAIVEKRAVDLLKWLNK